MANFQACQEAPTDWYNHFMIVLGIDPGLASVGWAVVKKGVTPKLLDYGCLATKPGLSLPHRLGQIAAAVKKLITKNQPQVLAIEEIFFAKNVKTAIIVAQVMGVIKMIGQQAGVEVCSYTPLNIKTTVAGYGRADKKQVEVMVSKTLRVNQQIKPDHAADAAAVCLTHLFTNQELVG